MKQILKCSDLHDKNLMSGIIQALHAKLQTLTERRLLKKQKNNQWLTENDKQIHTADFYGVYFGSA